MKKLQTASSATSGGQSKIFFNWQIQLLDQYANAVRSAMGSVGSEGGYVRIHFQDGETGSAYWKNLSPMTILNRATKKSVYSGSPSDAYAEYKWDFKIYKDTGSLANSITSPGNHINHKSIPFAGISGSNVGRASLLEEGGVNAQGFSVPARPLFMVANHMIITYIKGILRNPNSPMRMQMVSEFKSFCNWGSKTFDQFSTKRKTAIEQGWGHV